MQKVKEKNNGVEKLQGCNTRAKLEDVEGGIY
jgi:hypothetical protein